MQSGLRLHTLTHERTRMQERKNEKRIEAEGGRKTFNKHFNKRPSEVRFIFGLASNCEEAWRECMRERERGRVGEHIMSLAVCGEQLLAQTH